MKRWLLSLALAAAGFAAPAALAQEPPSKPPPEDVLVLADGKQTKRRGTVSSADHDKIVFADQKGGKKTDVPSSEVAEIVWGDAPQSYNEGLRALAAGDAESARRAFSDAVQEKGVKVELREWVLEYANAGLGQAYLLLGNADKAAEAFGQARAANAKSRVLDQILLGLAEAELARGKGDAAAKAADDLIAAGKATKRQSWELGAYLVKAKAKQRAGDFAGAVSAYDDAIRFADMAANTERNESAKRALQRAGLEAALHRGWVLVDKADASKSSADYEAARSYFESLSGKYPGEPSVLASASNAAGVARLAAGDAKTALRQFMTTEVVHFQARDEVARSLWYQAECWKKLGVEQSRAERLKDLKESFPGSEWARRAQ